VTPPENRCTARAGVHLRLMRPRIPTYAAAALTLLALAAVALLWTFVHRATAPQSASPSSATSVTTIAQPPNTKAYQSSLYHFSLYYPDDPSVSD